MFIEVWTTRTFGSSENWNKSADIWKKGAEIVKKHPAILDCRIFREMGGGNNNQIFAMYTFESMEKRTEFWTTPPEGLWDNAKEGEKSKSYDLDSMGTHYYYEV